MRLLLLLLLLIVTKKSITLILLLLLKMMATKSKGEERAAGSTTGFSRRAAAASAGERGKSVRRPWAEPGWLARAGWHASPGGFAICACVRHRRLRAPFAALHLFLFPPGAPSQRDAPGSFCFSLLARFRFSKSQLFARVRCVFAINSTQGIGAFFTTLIAFLSRFSTTSRRQALCRSSLVVRKDAAPRKLQCTPLLH